MWKNIKKQSIKQGKTLKKQIMYNIKIENHILDDEFGFFFIIKQIKFNRLLFFYLPNIYPGHLIQSKKNVHQSQSSTAF